MERCDTRHLTDQQRSGLCPDGELRGIEADITGLRRMIDETGRPAANKKLQA
jgi:hypothetical protein